MTNELTTFNPENIGNLPMTARYELKKQGGQEIKQVMLAKLHEDGRAYLTQTALEHAGALSALEQHLCEIAPQGAERYHHIVNSYVMGAANKIARW